MNARTKTLFHFTKSLDVLKRILKEGFWPHYSLEDVSWLEVPEYPKVAWPMVSFCNIPILRLREHTARFGNYGIGLCRDTMAERGISPVVYVSSTADSHLRDSLRTIYKSMKQCPDSDKQTAGKFLVAHCKPLKGEDEGKTDFYSECEWRFIPWVEGVGGENKYNFFLTEAEFNDEASRKQADDERRNDPLQFWSDDVRYLVVKTREEVHEMVCFIDSLPMDSHPWANSPVKQDMLKTRIIALDDVSCDF